MKLKKEFIEKLEKYIDEGFVSKRKHPVHPIYILNYTAATQFDWMWDEVTTLCRGLVINEDYNVVARSLPKFFSYEQLDGKLPDGEFVVEEKMDGSMLLVFNYNDEIVTATRGSFESDQAIDAVRFIRPDLATHFIGKGLTLVCEYIAKDNRIVVDYDYEGLVLLTEVSRDGTETRADILEIFNLESLGWKRPKIYSFESLEEILNYKEDNLEGFVLHYASGERVKIKLEDYKRLHRYITGFNEKNVWEALREGKLTQVLEEVPDEMYDFVKKVQTELESKFAEIRTEAMRAMKDLGNRKDNALYYQTCKYPSVMFYLLDGKSVDEMIWKMCRPTVTQTFKIISQDAD